MKILACLLNVLLCASGASAQRPAAPESRPGPAPPLQRVRLAPRFTTGTVLRYQFIFRTISESRHVGVVEDPQAPSQTEISWDAVVRLEVLGIEPDSSGHPAKPSGAGGERRARLRATYEKSAASVRSDSFDPQAADIEEQYRKLQGRTLQFTLGADGKVSEVDGLAEIVSDAKAASAAHEWLAQLAGEATAPSDGIVPGQKWSSERSVTSAPIAGLFWRTESTYLRDEQCRSTSSADAIAGVSATSGVPPDEVCAVILTRHQLAEPRARRDPTPDDYRQHGLRTAGKWSGSVESLSYVSLRTGWLVSLTQSGTEQMDVIVSTADGESHLRYAGRVRSQSHITLLPESTVAPR